MNLSQDLKPKLDLISRKTQQAKQKLRHVWDLVLQGNITEMEGATKRAFKDIDALESRYSYLFRLFPNNRFVTRSYARFSLDLKGDKQKFDEMIEKTKILHRGNMISLDLAHENAVKAYPQLSDVVKRKSQPYVSTTINESQDTLSLDTELDTECDPRNEFFSMIETSINEMRIPVVRGIITMRFVLLFIFFFAPSIFFLIYLRTYIRDTTEPLSFIYTVADIRNIVYQVTSFSMYFIFLHINVLQPELRPNTPYMAFGGSKDTHQQLKYLIADNTPDIQNVLDFQTYQTNYRNLKINQYVMFGNVINITLFDNTSTSYVSTTTVQNFALKFLLKGQTIAETPVNEINYSTLNNTAFLFLVANYYDFGNTLNTIMDLFNQYLYNQYIRQNNMLNILQITVIVVSIVLHLVLMVIELVWIFRTKNKVYESLISLPKNIVSTVIENLRTLKGENMRGDGTESRTGNTETSKQEDSVIKIFAAGTTSAAVGIYDSMMIAFGSLIILGITVGSFAILSDDAIFAVRRMRELGLHLNYVSESYSMELAALINLFMLCAVDAGHSVGHLSIEELHQRMVDKFAAARDAFQTVRFGTADVEGVPFSGFNNINNYALSMIKCQYQYTPPPTLYDAISCYSSSDFLFMMDGLVESRIEPWIKCRNSGDHYPLDSIHDTIYPTIWAEMVHPIYDIFLNPMFEYVIPTITSELNEQVTTSTPIIIVLVIIGFLVEIVIIFHMKSIDTHIRQVLSLYLQCPSELIMQINKCAEILSGDFSSSKFSLVVRRNDFFDELFDELPYCALWVNEQNIIENANLRFLSCFREDTAGKDITEVMRSPGYKLITEDILETFNGTFTYDDHIYSMSSVKINQKTGIALRDITQRIRYNTLIEEERQKSDYLLSSILPQSLVPRVQAGEKDISFAVQSATIIFIDIVSFTPWCGSLPADKVMMTLNLLFRKFDSLVAMYSTMTKIKCIGDCYMAAGGVFAEINQPSEHASEVVMFGLDAIESVLELNKELEETLKIRVGINTGGPIVAGVLGIGKPTFEILGPAINMAQQMEHHGVPMKVHISRSVYELIYGGSFNIKERGSIEIKNGSVNTYLVESKAESP